MAISRTRKRILLIEDDLDLRYSICSVLEDDGYETVSCIDAETGLRLLRAEKFDLLIVDHVLRSLKTNPQVDSISMDPNTNLPTVGTDWSSVVYNPYRNQWKVSILVADLPSPSFDMSCRLSVLRLRLNGAPNENFRTTGLPTFGRPHSTGDPDAACRHGRSPGPVHPGAKGADGTYQMNDWSFTQLCQLAKVSRDTVNRVTADTAWTYQQGQESNGDSQHSNGDSR